MAENKIWSELEVERSHSGDISHSNHHSRLNALGAGNLILEFLQPHYLYIAALSLLVAVLL